MYKHLTCLVVLKSCEAEQSTKEERVWNQNEYLTMHQRSLRASFLTSLHSLSPRKIIEKLTKLTQLVNLNIMGVLTSDKTTKIIRSLLMN